MVCIDLVITNNRNEIGGGWWKIGTSNHGQDPGQLQRLSVIDRIDSGVGMRTAQNLAIQHSCKSVVGPVLGAPCDFVESIMPDGTSTDYSETIICRFIGNCHVSRT